MLKQNHAISDTITFPISTLEPSSRLISGHLYLRFSYLVKTAVNHMNRVGVNHILGTRLGVGFDQLKRNNTPIDHLFLLGDMGRSVWQKGSKKGSEPNGVSARNDVVFFDRGRKDKITKVQHSFQSIRIERLVTRVQAHIDLIQKNSLKVTDLRRLVDPGGLNRRVSRCNR